MTPDGLKCYQTRLVPELAANGSLESVLGASCYITKNKQTEEALRESEQRDRLLIEGMNEGVIVADKNDSIWYVNEKFSEILGYLPSELIGHNILKFLDKADRKIIQEQRIRRRRGERGSYELGLRRNNGQKLFTLVSSIPFLGTGGSFKGRFAVVTDITALKVVESQQQQAKEQLRAVLDAVPGFVPWISSDGRYLGANRHLAESFNLSPDNFVSKELGFLKNSPEFVQFMAQFLASSVPTDRQVVEIQIKGSTRNYRVAAHKYNLDTVSVGIDITERIQAEEALKAQSKYQVFYDKTGESLRMTRVASDISAHKLAETQIRESLQEKEVLLQEIHHRIKNNLQVISSLLNLQSQQIDDSAMLEVFWESCNLVKSMALVHEQLYQSKDCARINCSEYIQNLTNCLFRAYGVNAD